MHETTLPALVSYLGKVPAIEQRMGSGEFDDGRWWVKFTIDISDDLAWQVVQELGFVLNYLSLDERLPTVFMPVSPPPYLNGGPKEYLSWVIESTSPEFTPALCEEWLASRLPRPVENRREWARDEDDA
jgi:hypothetical protein